MRYNLRIWILVMIGELGFMVEHRLNGKYVLIILLFIVATYSFGKILYDAADAKTQEKLID